MNNQIKARIHLTPQETIEYIGQELNEQVTEQDLCKLIKDDFLTLSVEFNETVFAKKGRKNLFFHKKYPVQVWPKGFYITVHNEVIAHDDTYFDEKCEYSINFQRSIILIEPGTILDFPHFRYNITNIDRLSFETILADMHKLPLILNNGEYFFKLLNHVDNSIDKIIRAIKKSRKEFYEQRESLKIYVLNRDPKEIDFKSLEFTDIQTEKKFFQGDSNLNNLSHHLIFRKERVDKCIEQILNVRREKEKYSKHRKSCVNLIRILSFELRKNVNEEFYEKLEDRKTCYKVIDYLLGEIKEITEFNKLNLLNDNGYLKKAIRANKKINGILLADVAASNGIKLSQATIYDILQKIKKFKASIKNKECYI